MRILYAGWLHEDGVAEHGPTYEAANFLPALRGMGHDVHVIDIGLSATLGVAHVTELLRDALAQNPYDLLFASLVHDDVDASWLEQVTSRGDVVTFNWFCDDHWRLESFSARWAPRFTWVSTTDASAIERYKKHDVHNVLLTQWAASTERYQPRGLPLKYDVSFIGQVYGDRRRIISNLRRSGVDARVWGSGWNTRAWHRVAKRVPLVRSLGGAEWARQVRASTRLSTDDMIATFEQSRINLNLAAASHGSRQQVKGRVFEVPAVGGFLLTERAERIDEFFVPDDEIGMFESPQEIGERVNWWLAHETQRERAARAAHARVLAEHTYAHRFAALFRDMGLPARGGQS